MEVRGLRAAGTTGVSFGGVAGAAVAACGRERLKSWSSEGRKGLLECLAAPGEPNAPEKKVNMSSKACCMAQGGALAQGRAGRGEHSSTNATAGSMSQGPVSTQSERPRGGLLGGGWGDGQLHKRHGLAFGADRAGQSASFLVCSASPQRSAGGFKSTASPFSGRSLLGEQVF